MGLIKMSRWDSLMDEEDKRPVRATRKKAKASRAKPRVIRTEDAVDIPAPAAAGTEVRGMVVGPTPDHETATAEDIIAWLTRQRVTGAKARMKMMILSAYSLWKAKSHRKLVADIAEGRYATTIAKSTLDRALDAEEFRVAHRGSRKRKGTGRDPQTLRKIWSVASEDHLRTLYSLYLQEV